jgi:hypothetical protein
MKCRICNQDKDVSLFTKKLSYCRSCDNERAKEYRRSAKGHAVQLFNDQKKNCRARGHNAPSYTKDEFVSYLLQSDNYCKLHTEWILSDYEKDLSPSCDRIDENKTYSFDNIQLCTWKENNERGYANRKVGHNNKQSRLVGKVINGEVIETYHSVNEAGRDNNISAGHISEVAYGKRKQVGGYKWVFLSDVGHKNRKVA